MTEQTNISDPTFMIIDDSIEDLYLTNYLIEKWAKSSLIDQFNCATKALAFLHKNSETIELIPDIILLDMNMPHVNGFEFIEEFAKLDPAIHAKSAIYMLSSTTDSVEVSKAEHHPFINMFVTKPLNKEKFSDILKNYFDLTSSEESKVKALDK